MGLICFSNLCCFWVHTEVIVLCIILQAVRSFCTAAVEDGNGRHFGSSYKSRLAIGFNPVIHTGTSVCIWVSSMQGCSFLQRFDLQSRVWQAAVSELLYTQYQWSRRTTGTHLGQHRLFTSVDLDIDIGGVTTAAMMFTMIPAQVFYASWMFMDWDSLSMFPLQRTVKRMKYIYTISWWSFWMIESIWLYLRTWLLSTHSLLTWVMCFCHLTILIDRFASFWLTFIQHNQKNLLCEPARPERATLIDLHLLCNYQWRLRYLQSHQFGMKENSQPTFKQR